LDSACQSGSHHRGPLRLAAADQERRRGGVVLATHSSARLLAAAVPVARLANQRESDEFIMSRKGKNRLMA
jgi:hypothetical protein